MRIYKDLELVEHLGSGLGRILKAYGKDSFVASQNFMKNIFYSDKSFDTQVTEQVILEFCREQKIQHRLWST